MSLYAVKNDKGEWMDDYGDFHPEGLEGNKEHTPSMFSNHGEADMIASRYGGHVVTLVEKPAPVVVSAEEAELLDKFKSGREWAAGLISKYATELFMNDKTNNVVALEDRLMRAYVNGWTVEKTKRWNVKVPHTELYYWKMYDDEVGVCNKRRPSPEMMLELCVFTAAEIEHYGLQDCEKEEATDDEQ